MTRVLILDDHPLILDGLRLHFCNEPGLQVVGAFAEARPALAALPMLMPDVAVIDLKLKDGLAFQFFADAKALLPELKIVIVTGYDDDFYVEKAFQAGASGYILKSEPLSEITNAIYAVTCGETYCSPTVRERFPEQGRVAAPSTRLSLLTKREREVLHHVSSGRSAKEISNELKISTWTVTNHKSNIMAKLGIHSQVGLTRFAVSTGLVDPKADF